MLQHISPRTTIFYIWDHITLQSASAPPFHTTTNLKAHVPHCHTTTVHILHHSTSTTIPQHTTFNTTAYFTPHHTIFHIALHHHILTDLISHHHIWQHTAVWCRMWKMCWNCGDKECGMWCQMWKMMQSRITLHMLHSLLPRYHHWLFTSHCNLRQHSTYQVTTFHTAPNSTHFAFQSHHVWNCNVPHQSHHIAWNHSTSLYTIPHHAHIPPRTIPCTITLKYKLHIPLSHSTHSKPHNTSHTIFSTIIPHHTAMSNSVKSFHITLFHNHISHLASDSTPPYSTCTTPFHIASPHWCSITHSTSHLIPHHRAATLGWKKHIPHLALQNISHHTGK